MIALALAAKLGWLGLLVGLPSLIMLSIYSIEEIDDSELFRKIKIGVTAAFVLFALAILLA